MNLFGYNINFGKVQDVSVNMPKTAEPIRPKFFVGPRVNPRKVYE